MLDLPTRLAWLHGSESLPEEWDRLAAAGPPTLSRNWLLADETEPPALVAVACDASGRLQGGLLAYAIGSEPPRSAWLHLDGVLADRVRRLATLGYPEIPTGLLEEMLPCLQGGAQSVTGSTVLVDRELAPNVAAALRAELVAAAEQRAEADGCASVAFLYVAEDDPLREVLRARGFLELAADGNAVLDVTWLDREGYLASRSPRRRLELRTHLRELADAGVEIGLRSPTDELLAAVSAVAHATHVRYGGDRTQEQLTERMRRLTARVATYVVTAEQAGRLVGFVFLHPWGNALHLAHYFGIDGAVRGRMPIYFATAFYEPASFAAEQGFRHVFYGPATLHAKIVRGCRIIRQYAYVRALDADLHARLGAALAHLLEA